MTWYEKAVLLISVMTLFFDGAILAWLIGTWFYEGNHHRCRVEVVCSHCGRVGDQPCENDPREDE